MKLIATGTRVTIVRAGSDTGRTGTVVAGSLWTGSDQDHGDRVVLMDDTSERLVFEGWMLEADETSERIAYTHPTPRHVRGPRHATEVHALANRSGDLVQSACGNLYTLHEAPHTPDGVRLTDRPVTCSRCH